MIWVIGVVVVAGQKPGVDALHNDVAKVGCSGCVDEVLLKF
jgi:hypothetical protein